MPVAIDYSHKSHNAPIPYPTTHHSEQKCAHFCSEWCIVGYGTGALWGLWDWYIPDPLQHVYNLVAHYKLFMRWSRGIFTQSKYDICNKKSVHGFVVLCLFVVMATAIIAGKTYLLMLFMLFHYSDVIMGTMTSQITSLTIVYSTFYSGADQRKYQSSASQAFVRGIHWWPVNSPHKWPVTWKMFPFDDIIMYWHQHNYKIALVGAGASVGSS